jgi:predicted RNase H-like HicB family nuclease
MEPRDILKRPYARVLTPEPDGQYTAEIMEFANCVASGDSATSALSNLEDVAVDWIAAALEQGQDIPEPMDSVDYSGRLVLRMPKGLHRRAALFAEREGTSLNQFIVTSLAEAVGEKARATPVQQFSNNTFAQVNLQIVGMTSGGSGPAFASQAGRLQLANSGPGILPIPRWETEREHA